MEKTNIIPQHWQIILSFLLFYFRRHSFSHGNPTVICTYKPIKVSKKKKNKTKNEMASIIFEHWHIILQFLSFDFVFITPFLRVNLPVLHQKKKTVKVLGEKIMKWPEAFLNIRGAQSVETWEHVPRHTGGTGRPIIQETNCVVHPWNI